MPHNLLVVDYGLGHPGSIHDTWAFQGSVAAAWLIVSQLWLAAASPPAQLV